MTSDDRSGRRVALAAVAGAHGVKGEIRLKLFTSSIVNLERHRELYVGGQRRRLLNVRESGKFAIMRVDGIADRSGAEALRGALIEVERSELPPLEEGEYYHGDLIGLAAVDRDGAQVGTVVAVENYGAGDLLEIELDAGTRSLIPFRNGIADVENGRIVLDRAFLA